VLARPRRVLIWAAAIFLVAAGFGAVYQVVAMAADLRSYPPPGELVDIGTNGRSLRLHIHCMGAGSPTVILEGGSGGHSSDWAWVQPEIARTTRVCAYDRAGVGWSEPSPSTRDAAQIARELRALLDRTGVAGPYVLVGHSYGGLFVRAFAASNPREVAGVVLVDSSHPEQWDRSEGGQEQLTRMAQIFSLYRVLTRVGLIRLVRFNAVHPDLPPRAGEQRKAMLDTTQFVDAAAEELAASPATGNQVRQGGTLGTTPLFVLTAGERGTASDMEQQWMEMQRELAMLSSNSVHRVAAGTEHLSLVLKEDHARETSRAIEAVVRAARSGGRLVAVE
jgi:pimeloyl-ACP methyl ester carboxylesterase